MQNLQGKRLLLLGGSMWKEAIQAFAEEHEITLIATGNDQSAGIFEIAQEKYTVNSTDHEAMKRLITEKKIDGVYVGGSEAVISAACEYLNDLHMPCYCNKKQWDFLQHKGNFKALCQQFDLPVVPRYSATEETLKQAVPEEAYPVITKPADGCGSSGFSICRNLEELKSGYQKAKENSASGTVIIEKFVDNNGFVVFLTFSNGTLYFSGMEDKFPVQYEKEGSYVAGLVTFESRFTENFRSLFEEKLQRMMSSIGIREGSVWIEVFCNGTEYYFNEVGYRYGGTVSIYPVDYFYSINQVASDIYYALTGESQIAGHTSLIPKNFPRKKHYAIYPIHLNSGTISKIEGVDSLLEKEEILVIPTTKNIGDTVKQTGSFAQAYALVHFVYDTKEELKKELKYIHQTLFVEDENGNNMVHQMLNPNSIL